jgi:hypothetical protein
MTTDLANSLISMETDLQEFYAHEIDTLTRKIEKLSSENSGRYIDTLLRKAKKHITTKSGGIPFTPVTDIVIVSGKAETHLGNVKFDIDTNAGTNQKGYFKEAINFWKESFINTLLLNKKRGVEALGLLRARAGEETPSLQLFLDLSGKETGSVSMQEMIDRVDTNMILAMQYTIAEFLYAHYSEIANFNDSTLKSAFNLKDGDILTLNHIIVADKYGVPLSTVASGIGNLFAKNIGISINNNVDNALYERVISSIGESILLVMEHAGYVERSKLKQGWWEKDGKIEAISSSNPEINRAIQRAKKSGIVEDSTNSYNTVRGILTNQERTAAIHMYKQSSLFSYLRTSPIEEESTASTPYKVDSHVLRGTAKIPKAMHYVLKKMCNTPYEIRTKGVELLKTYLEPLKRLMGYKSEKELEEMSYMDNISQKGKNDQIDRDIDTLFEHTDKGFTKGIFFKWVQLVNKRIMLASKSLNPQNSKLHRFLVIPMSDKNMADMSREEDRKKFMYNLSQAFGMKVSTMTDEEIEIYFNKIVSYELNTILEAISNTAKTEITGDGINEIESEATETPKKHTLKSLGISIPESDVGHFLAGLVALEAYKNSNGKPFTAVLGELDSSANGIFNRLLQFPSSSSVEFLTKIGVTFGKENKITRKGNTDLENFYTWIFKDIMFPDILDKGSYEKTGYTEEVYNGLNEAYTGLKGFLIENALQAEEKQTIVEQVYGAGTLSVINRIKDNFMRKIITAYVNGNEDVIKVINSETFTFSTPAGKVGKKDYRKMFINYSPQEIKVNVNGVSIGNFYDSFGDMLGREFGSVIAAKSEEVLKFIEEPNFFINTGVRIMYQLYEELYNKAYMEELQKKNTGKKQITKLLSVAEERKLKSRFQKTVSPSFADPLSEKPEEYITVSSTRMSFYDERLKAIFGENVTKELISNNAITYTTAAGFKLVLSMENTGQVQNHTNVGNDNTFSVSVTARIPIGEAPYKQAAVYQNHSTDSAEMVRLLTVLDPFTSIHDATVPNFNDESAIGEYYNGQLYSVNRDYDALGAVLNRLIAMKDEYDNAIGKGVLDSAYIAFDEVEATTYLGKKPNEKSDIYYIPLSNYLAEFDKFTKLNNSKKDMLNDTAMTVYNTDAPINGVYRVDGENRDLKALQKALEEVENKKGNRKDRMVLTKLPENSENSKIINAANIAKTVKAVETKQKSTADIKDVSAMKPIKRGFTKQDMNFPKEYTELNKSVSIADSKARVEIFERLNEEGAEKLPESVFNEIKTFLESISGKFLEEIQVLLNENAKSTGGLYADNEIRIWTNKYNADKDKPWAEVYAHEVVHAVTVHVLENSRLYGKVKELKALLDLQLEASKLITPYDLMPDNPIDTVADTERAKELWNYMFNNPEDKAGRKAGKPPAIGLSEFIARAVTNPKVAAKLNMPLKVPQKEYKTLRDKVLHFFRNLVDVIVRQTPFRESFPMLAKFIQGNTALTAKSNTIKGNVMQLVADLSAANEKVRFQSDIKAADAVMNLLGNGVDKMNAKGREYIERLSDYVMKTPLVNIHELPKDATYAQSAAWLAKAIPLLIMDKKHRENYQRGLSYYSTNKGIEIVQTFLQDISKPDDVYHQLEVFGNASKEIEREKLATISAFIEMFADAFGEPLTRLQKQALMKGVLYTDIQALFEDMDYETVRDLVTDRNRLDKAIKDYKDKILQAGDYTAEQKQWILNQAESIAYFMITNKGHEALNLNSYNIATGVHFRGKTKLKAPTKALAAMDKNIDIYASLLAIRRLPEETLSAVFALKKEGVESFIKAHKSYINIEVTKSPDHEANRRFLIKGYAKQVFDSTKDSVVLPIKYAKSLKEQGYTLVSHLDGIFGLYINPLSSIRHRNGNVMIYEGMYSSNMRQINLNRDSELYSEEMKELRETYLEVAKKEKERISKLMQRSSFNAERVADEGFKAVPLIDTKGDVIDFKLILNNEIKENYLDQNLDGIEILSKMFGTQEIKMRSKEQNKEIFNILLENMQKNKPKGIFNDRFVGNDRKWYTALTEDSNNPFIQEVMKSMPSEARKIIVDNNLYVREDMLAHLFGIQDISALDIKALKKLPFSIRKTAAKIENILRWIAAKYKQIIVIKTPKVLLGNIISNINYSIATGNNPLTVLKTTLTNAGYLRNYLNNQKELYHLRAKQRAGADDKETDVKIKWLLDKLALNPVYKFIEMGLFQNVTEDLVSEENLENLDKKVYERIKIATDKIPSPIKTIASQIYMTEDTKVFQFLNLTVKYSDFIARVTHYQLEMAKAPKEAKAREQYEKELLQRTLNAFINYDRPVTNVEQYINDMGFVQFTKYSKRIQHVIGDLTVNHPVSFLLHAAFQWAFIDVEEAAEKQFSPASTSLINTPLEVLEGFITPPAYKWGRWIGLL